MGWLHSCPLHCSHGNGRRGVQVRRLRDAVDRALLDTLLDMHDCGALAKRLGDKHAKERAAAAAGHAPPPDGAIAGMHHLHRLTDAVVKELFAGDAAALEQARRGLQRIRQLSVERRAAAVAQDLFPEKDLVRCPAPVPCAVAVLVSLCCSCAGSLCCSCAL